MSTALRGMEGRASTSSVSKGWEGFIVVKTVRLADTLYASWIIPKERER